MSCHTGSSCLWVGESSAAHLRLEPGERAARQGRQAARGGAPAEGAVRPCAAFPGSRARGPGAPRRWNVCSLAPVPLERLLPQAGQPLLLWLHSCCSDYISNKKSSDHAGRLLYSSSSEPGPTLLHFSLSQTSLTVPSLRESNGAYCPRKVRSRFWSCA